MWKNGPYRSASTPDLATAPGRRQTRIGAATVRRGPGRPKKIDMIPLDRSVSYLSTPKFGKDFPYGIKKANPIASSRNVLADAIDRLVEARVRALFAELAGELRS